MVQVIIALSLVGAGEPGSPGGAAPWSFRAPERVAPPVVADAAWPRTAVDRFILARLETAGLRPAPEASRAELIRRLSFDLTGLPPSPGEVAAFERDPAPDAYERLVERLLASPHHGERWAQHWLDVVRYAESEGFEYDRHLPGAWRYRDWVIRALNDDLPYDRFVAAQLAGDEIDPGDRDLQAAAGFHRLGPVRRNAGNQEVAGSRNEVLTERTDIIGSAFLGLTLGCARCHDHKFDPIPQKDYYRFQAFVAATEERDVPLAAPEAVAAREKSAAAVQAEIDELSKKLERAPREERKRLREAIAAARRRLPEPLPAVASIRDAAAPTPIHVLERGDWDRKGEAVGMRPPAALLFAEFPELPPASERPRARLARWITDPANPLAARVAVNRIWQHHFGSGIVATANDFGSNGGRPSHPELLDYLARAFIDGGWRWKPIHKLILLSSAYRQSSRRPPDERAESVDPEDRLLWKFPRRRLSAEEVRDAMLAASGRLNPRIGGESVIVPVEQELVDLLYDPAQWSVAAEAREHDRRSIYLIAKRNLRLPFLEVFDQPALLTSCGRRESSTHSLQALELLNGRLANDLAAALAARLRREAGPRPERQVDLAFRLAAGRAPSAAEARLALEYLAAGPLEELALAMFNLNAFLYVD